MIGLFLWFSCGLVVGYALCILVLAFTIYRKCRAGEFSMAVKNKKSGVWELVGGYFEVVEEILRDPSKTKYAFLPKIKR